MKKVWTDISFYLYIFLVIVLSIIIEIIINITGNQTLYLPLMWIPGLVAILVNVVSIIQKKEKLTLRQFLNRLGFKGSKLRYTLLAMLLPLIYLLIPYMFYWNKYPNDFAYSGVPLHIVLSDVTLPLLLGNFLGIISALGEELGWRGYLLPASIERIGIKKSLLFTSIFWALWHLPVLIWGDYMTGASIWYKIPAFILCIIPVGIMIGILTIKSKSVWPAAFLHAAHNNYDQSIFGVITRGENMMYYVSETGILTILCAWILALLLIWYYRKDKELMD